jgi:isocitrate dehydrogenase
MKMTDGLFHKVFDEIGNEYPQIEKEHWIVDIGAAKLADTPEIFDMIVMPNLYGDILSDVAAQISGSVGLAGSSNIGEQCAMFEAIHGSAPRRAGLDMANPSGLILASVQMLIHMGQGRVAEKIHNAWLKTIEDGIHTYDIYQEGISKSKVGTKAFTKAICERLGQNPVTLESMIYLDQLPLNLKYEKDQNYKPAKKELVGVDIFIHENNRNPNILAEKLMVVIKDLPLELEMITNRGVKVWPHGMNETFCTDHWRCRLMTKNGGVSNHAVLWMLLRVFSQSDLEVIKIENLYLFDGEKGYSLGQGQ